MNLLLKRQLPTPEKVKKIYPINEGLLKIKKERDEEIKKIFKGEVDKFILIIGPCSADREDAVIDYIKRLRVVQDKEIIKNEIFIIPRIYTNKPRTTGDGYKGMLHQPNPLKSPDMVKGILAIRKMHMRALEEAGFSCADEMLYPENHSYLSDLLSYVAVGARSVENQQHRLTASGVDVPVVMKNPTSGDLSVMLNAIRAGEHSHTFIYRNYETDTKGNPFTHAILRGYVNHHGEPHPNYHYEDLVFLEKLYKGDDFINPAVIIDVNHSNSAKKYEEQIRISKEVLHSCSYNKNLYKLIKGLMIESYIEDGSQKPDENIYGKSITDPCIGWEKTEKLINELAEYRVEIKKKFKIICN